MLVNYSEADRADVFRKLNTLRHRYFIPRMLRSVLDQVFYVVESARHNLRIEGAQPEWGAFVALEMYQFYSVLEAAVRAAREVEQATGFSGEALSAEAGE
jgi:hypothetical protein